MVADIPGNLARCLTRSRSPGSVCRGKRGRPNRLQSGVSFRALWEGRKHRNGTKPFAKTVGGRLLRGRSGCGVACVLRVTVKITPGTEGAGSPVAQTLQTLLPSVRPMSLPFMTFSSLLIQGLFQPVTDLAGRQQGPSDGKAG